MAALTVKEKTWLKKVQKILDECPSNRVAFYTTGDNEIYAYDISRRSEIYDVMDKDGIDFCAAVQSLNASFDFELEFSNAVESTAG